MAIAMWRGLNSDRATSTVSYRQAPFGPHLRESQVLDMAVPMKRVKPALQESGIIQVEVVNTDRKIGWAAAMPQARAVHVDV